MGLDDVIGRSADDTEESNGDAEDSDVDTEESDNDTEKSDNDEEVNVLSWEEATETTEENGGDDEESDSDEEMYIPSWEQPTETDDEPGGVEPSDTETDDESSGIESFEELMDMMGDDSPFSAKEDESTAPCPACGRIGELAVNPQDGDHLWYYRCLNSEDCDVLTFTYAYKHAPLETDSG